MNNNILIIKVFNNTIELDGLSLADWDLLLRQARQGNLLAKLHAILSERGQLASIPEAARRHLEWQHTVAERHTLAVQWEVRQIQQALAHLDLPVILLKGAAYVMAGLPAAQGRVFTDIDILVPKQRLNEVEAALMLHGWASTHHDAYDQHYYRAWMHELPPMQHRKRLTVIDVHHAILPDTAALHPDAEKLRAAACPLTEQLAVLAPVDMVLHSATHLFHGGELENGLRDLLDIDSLLRHFGALPDFWNALTERAQEQELSRPLFYALRYAKLLLHTPIPPDVALEEPNRFLLALMDRLFSRALLHGTDRLTVTARRMLYLRANWQRMPPLLLARHLFHKAFISPKAQ